MTKRSVTLLITNTGIVIGSLSNAVTALARLRVHSRALRERYAATSSP
ncbi:MAG: hypothetical protein QOD51_2936 [Candidatus Eremiobacteraeota bacterium]|jgi:hypothetical protein|nr:hypothetical protein [Candidatus Eremiobacteraeota bacterium]